MERRFSTILKFITMTLFTLFIGCETDQIIFQGPYFVRFTNQSLTIKESASDPIKIEVHLAGPAMSQDVTINYKVTGNARAGIDYTIVSDVNKVTIKKGEYFGYITVQLINNANNILRSQNLVFTLLTITPSSLQVGLGPSQIGDEFTLTIQDDCILSGTYSGVQNVFDIPIEDIKITSTDCENYSLSNWNINVFSPPYEYPLDFIDNGDNTLTIPEQEIDTKLKGKGIVDPLTKKITLTIILEDFDDEELTITLTPN
ncbi:MAG TPA: hypothetical protein VFE57_12225 [Cyclobacteriaceae bacterium]|nr:hypothetical protein [Cyclobacteriaceae bacterium]